MCKYQNHFYSFNRKQSSIRKNDIFSMFLTYYRTRGHPFSGYTAFSDALFFFIFVFLCPIFMSVTSLRFILSLSSDSLLYGMRETRGAFPLQCESNERWKCEASAVTPERSSKGEREKKREREKERELVRRKDNRTIKSQIRGQLVLGRVSRGCRRNSQETREKVC